MSRVEPKERYIILGAGGQLGQAFVRQFEAEGVNFIALRHADADLAAPDTLPALLEALPLRGARALINCAAYTNVDGAEKDEKTATTVNGEAVGVLAAACKEADVPLIHFSTDYVFNGTSAEPLGVDQPREPLNAYGRSKACGEELLEQSGADYLLIRTSWVYSSWGKNFVKTMSHFMRARDSVKVVDDQHGRPTHVIGLAARSLELLKKGEHGTFHITDEGICTWYVFAKAIAAAIGNERPVNACTSAEFPLPAARPQYGILSSERADKLLGPAVHYEARLKSMAAELNS